MAKQATIYVDVDPSTGKALPLGLMAICAQVGIKEPAMRQRIATYRDLQRQAGATLDGILADLEKAMTERGALAPEQALMPWFNFGQENVVRIIGQRHGVPKVKSANPGNAASNVASLFSTVAPMSRLMPRRK